MKKSYFENFDFYRSLALIGVFIYHLNKDQFLGGYLGVVTFFVMAGFLSMWQIINQNERQDFKSRVYKKAQKLLPPLVFVILIVTIYTLVRFPEFLPDLKWMDISAILGVNNIAQVIKGNSYFDNIAYLKPITHIWALSLEMQFYFLFYLIVERYYKNKDSIIWVISFFALSVLSYILSIVIYSPGVDPTRIYYGLDTRLYSFLAGMIAAILIKDKVNYEVQDKYPKLKALFLLILVLCTIIPFKYGYPGEFMYKYGFLLYTLVSVFSLVILSEDNIYFSRFTSNKVFKYISSRSYWIYLWHYPIIQFFERDSSYIDVAVYVYYIIEILITLIISELSYRMFRKEILMNYINKYFLPVCLSLALCFTVMPFQVKATEVKKAKLDALEQKIEENQKMLDEENKKIEEEKIKEDKQEPKVEKVENVTTTTTVDEKKDAKPKSEEQLEVERIINKYNKQFPSYAIDLDDYNKYRNTKDACLIGDSLSTITYKRYKKFLPNIHLEAKGCRLIKEGPEVYKSMKQNNTARPVVVVALGTNALGEIKSEFYDPIVNDKSKPSVIIVSVAFPSKPGLHKYRNTSIYNYVNNHKETYLVDWGTLTKGRNDLFGEDLIHPNGDGADAYAFLITSKIIQALKDREARNVSPVLEVSRVEKPQVAKLNAPKLKNTPVRAYLNGIDVMYSGRKNFCRAYNIDSTNYVRLKDIEALLKNSPKMINVTWEEKSNLVSIQTKHMPTIKDTMKNYAFPYEVVGTLRDDSISVDGKKETLRMYLSNETNFVKLRDIMEILNVRVDYDESSGIITLV